MKKTTLRSPSSSALPWLLTLALAAPAAAQGPAPFPNPMIPVGANPNRLLSADLNGDGLLDVATANEAPGTLVVLLRSVAGGFAPAVSYGDGSTPKDFAIADLNGDGILDLANPDAGTALVRVRLGTGTGAFGASAGFAAAATTTSIAVGEFNGDGWVDLAVGSPGAAKITLLTGNGAGAFVNTKVLTTVGQVNNVAAADLDGDGDGDLCYSIQTSSWVWILTNTSHLNFAQTAQLATGQTPGLITIADHNFDGRADLVVSSESGGPAVALAVFLGIPGGFQGPNYVPNVPSTIPSYDVRDWNGDGFLDLIGCPTGKTAIFLGNGAGAFPSVQTWTKPLIVNDVVLVDATGDGIADVVNLSRYAGGLFVSKGLPGGGFEETPNYSTGANLSRHVRAGDFDHDGAPDLVTANYSGSVSVLRGVGDGSFLAPTIYLPGPSVSDVALADLNHDGELDIVSCNETGGGAGVSSLLGDGTGAFTIFQTAPITQFPWACEVADFDEDGNADVLTMNLGTDDLALVLGTGTGAWQPAIYFPSGSVTLERSLAIGDWNTDGHVDAAIAGNQSTIVRVFSGDGLGNLGFASSWNAGTTAIGLRSADADQDGRGDLVVAGSAGIVLLKGDGAGSFAAVPIPLFPAGVQHVYASDVDGDGVSDLVASKSEEVYVAIASAPGAFGAPTAHAAGTGSVDTISLADVNLDGRQDVLAPSLYNNAVTPLLNLGGLPAGTQVYGVGTSGCRGRSVMNSHGSAIVGNAAFGLTTSNAPAGALGLLIVGNLAYANPTDFFGIGLDLVVDLPGSTQAFGFDSSSDSSGIGYTAVPIPNNPILVGSAFVAQSIWIEPPLAQCSAALAGLVSSNGLLFTIQ